MRLGRESIDALTANLNGVSDAAQKALRERLALISYESIEDLRNQVIEIMVPICGAAADYSAALTADFYDAVRQEATGNALGAAAEAMFDRKAVEGAVRALVQIVVDEKPMEEFADRLCDRVDYEVKKASGNCVQFNARRDPLKPRFARVPTGNETCGFCLMLASRGFVYTSSNAAGAMDHYHPNCDCRVVPGFPGMEVSGYDSDKLYRKWKRSVGLQESRKQIKRILGEGASGVASFETRNIEPHEFRAYVELMRDGREFTVLAVNPEARRRGKSSPDVFMGGYRYELKCPDGANPKKTIGRNLNTGIAQMKNADPPAESVRLILSGMETVLTRSQIEHAAKKKMNQGDIDELIVIYGESDIVTYKKAEIPFALL